MQQTDMNQSKGMMYWTQTELTGIASTIAGIISATGKFRIFAILKPVAINRNPPQALKSAIMTGVVRGKMILAARNRPIKITV